MSTLTENTITRTAIARLHCLTQDLPDKSHVQQVELACTGGARWIQLRVKGKDIAEWETIARAVKQVCDRYNASLIINDNVELARKLGTGVHLGKNDMHPAEARAMLGNKAIIGGTVNCAADYERIRDSGIDYVGVGPYRFTTTKENLSTVLQREELEELIQLVHPLPAIVIGGVTAKDIHNISALGAHGLAVSSAINKASDPAGAVQEFLDNIKMEQWKS